jgi:hypothetical protein
MRRGLPSRSVRTHLPSHCWMVSISSPASSLRRKAQSTRSATRGRSRACLSATPQLGRDRQGGVHNAVTRVFWTIAPNAGKGERGRRRSQRSVTIQHESLPRVFKGRFVSWQNQGIVRCSDACRVADGLSLAYGGTAPRHDAGGVAECDPRRFRVSILRQSRRLYDCWPLKGA